MAEKITPEKLKALRDQIKDSFTDKNMWYEGIIQKLLDHIEIVEAERDEALFRAEQSDDS